MGKQSSSEKTKSTIRCYNCGKMGHTKKNCKNKPLICNNCKKTGHYASECRAVKSKNTDPKQPQHKATLNVCEENDEVTKLMVTDGYINKIHLKKIAFDIGATTSIMSERVAKEHRIPLNDTQVKIRVADGREAKVIGITDNVQVRIKNHKTKLRFVVINHNEYDVLLGLDYFNKTG